METYTDHDARCLAAESERDLCPSCLSEYEAYHAATAWRLEGYPEPE